MTQTQTDILFIVPMLMANIYRLKTIVSATIHKIYWNFFKYDVKDFY
jgi:hypothetical protein